MIQYIIDILRLKRLKLYIRQNKFLLFCLLNFPLLFTLDNDLFGFRRRLLKFLGMEIGTNVCLGMNLSLISPENIKIGDNTWININANLCSWDEHKIEIGKNNLISVNFNALAGSHSVSNYENLIGNQNIKIGDGVWIGANVTILGGVTIGNGSIIGAGSVVTKDIPPFKIAAGCPAKIIKDRIAADIIKEPIVYNKKDLLEND